MRVRVGLWDRAPRPVRKCAISRIDDEAKNEAVLVSAATTGSVLVGYLALSSPQTRRHNVLSRRERFGCKISPLVRPISTGPNPNSGL